VLAAAAAQGTLIAEDSGVITPAAHSMGDDALWMGHAWVNGQDGQTDLNALVARLKKTGIRDLTLLIGAPAYDTGGPWPFSSAESIASAIRGVRLAISPVPPKRPLGIALYVDFTATAHDWTTYINNWVH
jgi:hypothetical protein